MVEYLDGGRIQGSSTKVSTPPQTSWKELGRTTLGSAHSDITVSSFTAKDNLMVLHSDLGRSSDESSNEFRLNGDTNANYSSRSSSAGETDGLYTSDTGIVFQRTSGATNQFSVTNLSNISNKEKISVTHKVQQRAAGAGNAPHRSEAVGKWANTSNAVTSWTSYTGSSDTWNAGSEVVVLGCDNDEADSGTNFWQELASVTASGSSGTLDSGTFTAKKYLMIEAYGVTGGSNMDNMGWRVNSDSGNNYARRVQHNAGTDSTATSQSFIRFGSGSPAGNDLHISTFIINKSDKEKLFINECNRNKSTGAGNVPERFENVGKWTNTSSQITSIQLMTDASNWTTDSYLKVWGAD